MWLDSPIKSLQLVLSAVPGNPIPWAIDDGLVKFDNSTSQPVGNQGNLTGTSPVTILSAPAQYFVEEPIHLSVVNEDTAAATVAVKLVVSGTSYTIARATLSPGDNFYFTLGAGWYVNDSTGARKQTGGGSSGTLAVSGGGTGLTSLTAHAVLLGEGTAVVGTAVPGTAGLPLVSAGASADPTFSALGVAGGGTGLTAPTAYGVLIGEGASPLAVTTPGTAGQVLTSNGASADPTFQTPAAGGGITAGYIRGLEAVYVDTTHVLVRSGKATDSTDSNLITLASDTTCTASNTGAINNQDLFIGTGTVTGTGTTTVTGSGTSFLTAFGTRTATGTIAGASTTITGTGTKFLSEVAVNDMVGTAAVGYSLVTAIASDTSLTITAALPGGNPGGAAFKVIESPFFDSTLGSTRPSTITSNTVLTLPFATAALSGQTWTVGKITTAAASFVYLWLVTGGSGTGLVLSTQRTAPFPLSGYTTGFRRIASLLYYPFSSALTPFCQSGRSHERWYQYEVALGGAGTLILSGGAATAWTAVLASGAVPPTSRMFYVNSFQSGNTTYFRCRGTGDATVTRALRCGLSNALSGNQPVICDGAQAIDYAVSGGTTSLYVTGYHESLI